MVKRKLCTNIAILEKGNLVYSRELEGSFVIRAEPIPRRTYEALALGLILMPRFFMIIVEGIGSAFRWPHAVKDGVSMIAPGILMNALSDFNNTTNLLNAAIGFSAGVLVLFIIAYLAFCRQDEYNYGE